MKLIILIPLVAFFSCQPKIDIQKENYIFQKNLEAYNYQRYRLEDYYSTIEETAQDKSSGSYFLSKVTPMFLHIDSMRNELEVIIKEIETLKKDILQKSGNKLSFGKNDFRDSLALQTFDFKNFSGDGGAKHELYKVNPKFQKIKSDVFKFRNKMIQHVVNSSSTLEMKFTFKDPKVLDFSDEKKYTLLLEKSLNHVAPDDYEMIKQFYYKISLKNPFLDKYYEEFLDGKSVIDQINILTNVETQVLSLTTDLFALIRSRIGCGGGYRFDKIFVNVDGPEAVQKGDSIELRVFYSFYDSYANPIITFERVECKQYLKDGITYIKFKASEKDELIKGKITILNKSGVPKTMNWEKKIKVISPN